jgi:rRNA processing protein Gar1
MVGVTKMDIALWVAVIGGLFSVAVVFVTKLLESRSANIAVLAEIQRLLKVLDRHKTWWEACIKSGDTQMPLVAFTTPVFDEQVKTIGNVNSRVVANVVAFYGYVKFINAIQGEKSKYVSAGKEDQFNAQYLGILSNVLRDYRGKFDEAFRKYHLL